MGGEREGIPCTDNTTTKAIENSDHGTVQMRAQAWRKQPITLIVTW